MSTPTGNSCVTPPADMKSRDATIQLRDVHSCFLSALQKSADAEGAHLPELLLAPKCEIRWAEDGCVLVRQATRKECKRKFEAAVALITAARWEGAHVWGKEKLDDRSFRLALDWLKNEYEAKFMTWPGLKDARDDWNDGSFQFSRDGKRSESLPFARASDALPLADPSTHSHIDLLVSKKLG